MSTGIQRAILYARFSPRPGRRRNPLTGLRDLEARIEDGETIQCQFDICRKYCEMRGFEIADELGDRFESARHTPMFQREHGKKLEYPPLGVQHIVVAKLDRLFRDVEDGLSTIRHWRKQGITVHLANQGGNCIDLGTAIGELFLTMMLGISKFEARQISERTSVGMLHRQKIGQRMYGRNKIAYGYMLDPSDSARIIENKEEIYLIAQITKLHLQGLRPMQISAWLQDNGFTVRGSEKWTYGRIQSILRQRRFDRERLEEELGEPLAPHAEQAV